MSEKSDKSRPNQEARLAREQRLSRVLDDAGAGIFFLDRNGRFVRTNATMCHRLLYAPGELDQRSAVDMLDPATAGEMKTVFDEMLALKRAAFRHHIRYRRRDGSFFWGDLSLSLILDPDGAFETVIGVVIDINEQKQAEERLRQSEAWFRVVFDKSGAASIIIEPDMTIAMANEEFEKLTGFRKDEIEGRIKWSAFIAPEDVERMSGYHYQRRQPDGGAPGEYECRIINRAGQARDIFIKVGMLPDGQRSIASFMDITALKKTAGALQESEAKLLSIIEAVEGLIYTCGRDFTIGFMNKALAGRVGGDAVGRVCYRTIYRRETPCPWCALAEVFGGRAVRREFENPVDGRWYDAMMSPIFDPGGAVSHMESFVIDITERKLNEQALQERELSLHRENVRLKSSIRERFRFGDIIGKSPAMQRVYELILSAAATDANVIIYGESGTGKELVARAVHDMSRRAPGPFVIVNCGAIPESLLESEFFGYCKGAFTGADKDKHGYLDLADGGTLFLDELGEIGHNMQVKLLRVIEGQGYLPVGGERVRQPSIRIIAATNQDLAALVRQGRMREDFFYRIHVIPIHLPPLRERKEDIPLLIDHFMRRHENQDRLPLISGRILDAALAHHWPGNVRELQNVLHRYVTLNRFDLLPLPLKDSTVSAGPAVLSGTNIPAAAGLAASVENCEKELILRALEQHRWHRGRAAADLGIHRRTLFKKMKKHKIDKPNTENDRSQ